MLREEIKKIVDADPSFYLKAWRATITTVNIGSVPASVTVIPKNGTLPQMTVPIMFGGCARMLPGDDVLVVFDSDSSAYALPNLSTFVSSDFVPLGSVLVSYLGTLFALVTTHVHVAPSGTPPAPGFTGPIDSSVPTTSAAMASLPATLITLLSTSAKVQT
jgi:hypothetical protein